MNQNRVALKREIHYVVFTRKLFFNIFFSAKNKTFTDFDGGALTSPEIVLRTVKH